MNHFLWLKSHTITLYLNYNKMAYSEKVIEHYNNPQNVGTLDKNKSSV